MTHAESTRLRANAPVVLRRPAAFLLGAILLLIVVLPFVEGLEGGEFVEPLLLTLVLTSAIFAPRDRSRVRWWAGGLAVLALGGAWVHHLFPSSFPRTLFTCAGLVFVGFLVFRLLRSVVRSARIDSEVLCAGVSTYLLIAVLWAFAYDFCDACAPGGFAFSGPAAGRSMTGFTSLYFSLVTLTTVGYGEIVPATGVTRMLAATEAVAGVLCVAVLMARLVAGYAPGGAEIAVTIDDRGAEVPSKMGPVAERQTQRT